MALPDPYSLTSGAQAVATAAPESGPPQLIHVATPLVVLTWVTFLILMVVLYKVAWKPILAALELREGRIRKALEDLEKARSETATLEARQKQLLQETETRTRKMLDDARQAALDTAHQVESRERDEAKALVSQAQQEIQGAVERARADLRREAGGLAIAAATRILGENMDTGKNRELVEKLIQES